MNFVDLINKFSVLFRFQSFLHVKRIQNNTSLFQQTSQSKLSKSPFSPSICCFNFLVVFLWDVFLFFPLGALKYCSIVYLALKIYNIASRGPSPSIILYLHYYSSAFVHSWCIRTITHPIINKPLAITFIKGSPYLSKSSTVLKSSRRKGVALLY